MNQLSTITKKYVNETLGVCLTAYKDQSGEFWFVGKEVASGLGYADQRKAIALHVHEGDKCGLADVVGRDIFSLPCNWQPHKKLINESGFYALILGSHKPKALGFKRWVTKEVLPSIRKTGYYALPEVLVAIRGVDPDSVRELDGDEKKEFRGRFKYLSDLAKDSKSVSRGARGGEALWKKIRNTEDEYENVKVRISELEAENDQLKTENEDLSDDLENLGFDNVILGSENRGLVSKIRTLKETLKTKA